jgi:large subunit ribosomal protein L18
VHKTNRNLSAQLIDDENGITLASFGTMSKELRTSKKSKMKPKDAARSVGQKLAELAKQKNIKAVVFDRGRFKFHGVIAELANAAREGGMQF